MSDRDNTSNPDDAPDPDETQLPTGNSEESTALPLGRSVGKYLLMRQLGAGGMGVVYEAFDPLLHRSVALKLLARNTVAGPELERFLREARAAIQLQHPNVVTTYDVNRAGSVYFIALELVPGGSAQQRIDQRGRLPWQEATRIIADACRGLAAAHERGMIHRDVKPSNILLSDTGAKLADFGLVKISNRSTTSLTARGQVAGTPAYMAPEQCRAEPIDERTDVYSLGATYYTLLTGHEPYPGDSAMQVMFAHCSRSVPDPRHICPEIPQACVAIIHRAMAKEPGERQPSAVALLAELTALSAEIPPQPPRPQPGSRPSRRRILAAAGLLAGVGMGTTAWYFRPTPTTPPVTPPPPTVPWGRILNLKTTGQPAALAFTPSGDRLLWTCSQTSGVWSWSSEQDEPDLLFPLRKNTNVLAVSSNGRYLAIESSRSRLGLYELSGGRPQLIREFPSETAGILAVAFLDSGEQVVLALHLWANEHRDRTTLLIASVREDSRNQHTLGEFGAANSVAPLPGQPRVVVGTTQGQFVVYDYQERRVVDQNHVGLKPIKVVAVSPDGTRVAIGGGPSEAFTHGVEVYHLKSGQTVLPLNGHTRGVGTLAFSPDGNLLASGGYDHDVRLWDLSGSRRHALLKGHSYIVTGLAFSPDGTWLASTAWDDTVRLWAVSEHVGEKMP